MNFSAENFPFPDRARRNWCLKWEIVALLETADAVVCPSNRFTLYEGYSRPIQKCLANPTIATIRCRLQGANRGRVVFILAISLACSALKPFRLTSSFQPITCVISDTGCRTPKRPDWHHLHAHAQDIKSRVTGVLLFWREGIIYKTPHGLWWSGFLDHKCCFRTERETADRERAIVWLTVARSLRQS